ncbi:M1 family metallopeptidase [Micromonospora parathelypteridis]|uniref:Aminopeptidase N n=1 Tax=Micromonospora parathelypteridis TaxID=1839617 RepID=A0A840VKN5_9ACTN|nr:M1 family metallopeptidase [Micromonospora parathelypteridis]MBB5477513.1 aminopeptidase N [Micromonospora parathelypteridis]GGO10217.1 peptidase [Micromonospora parathelypteridis]
MVLTGRTPAGSRVAATVALTCVIGLIAAGCTGDDGGGFRPGAADVGDPYVPGRGNGGYDVTHYGLDVRYDPSTDRLTGRAVITATATQDLSRFNLDLAGLDVGAVTVGDARADHRRGDGELVVTPRDGLPRGRQFTVTVDYGGVPTPVADGALGSGGFLHTADGAVALGQPDSAATWFPVNDHPSDKATYDLAVTVPDGLAALSNGVPGPKSSADGWTTWRWSERAPMASYLSTLVIGNYRVVVGTHAGRPMVTAVAASLPPAGGAATSLARTGAIVDFLASRFGPYPFDSYGGIAIADDRIGYALETQSRPVYGPAFFTDDRPNLSVVAHELAHQWFGDSVSVGRWSDIWLNEGFASYAEWLWEEHDGGRTAQRNFELQYATTDWSQPSVEPGREGMFGAAVYKRGALAVHALRRTVGDDMFFRILRTWTAERAGGNATTSDLVALAERVAGRQLRPLFDAWLVGGSAPTLP